MKDYLAVTEDVMSCTRKGNRKESYTHWSNKEKLVIENYAAENGYAATIQKFANKEKPLNEDTVKKFCKRYKSLLHLMRAIARAHGSTRATSLMHVKNSTRHFLYDT